MAMTVSDMAIADSPQAMTQAMVDSPLAIAATASSWGESCGGDCSTAVQAGAIWLAGSRVANVVRVVCSTPMLKF